jgi:hypothetical protein
MVKKRAKAAEPASVKMVLRVRPDLRTQMQALADRHLGKFGGPGNLSREIKDAMRFWIKRHDAQQLHTSELTTAIGVLAERIERLTEKSWEDSPQTQSILRSKLLELVDHFLPQQPEHAEAPADVRHESDFVLSLIRHSLPRSGPARLHGAVTIDDPDLMLIVQDKNQRLRELEKKEVRS